MDDDAGTCRQVTFGVIGNPLLIGRDMDIHNPRDLCCVVVFLHVLVDSNLTLAGTNCIHLY